jgi:prepilin-type N-terminal cleavage/methylation domain-containing protein
MRNFNSRNRRGFTLVEVVLALAVVAFCLVTLMGLLATGLVGNKTTLQKSVAVNIAGAVAADLRATPLSNQNYSVGETLYTPRFNFTVPVAAPPSGGGLSPTGMQTVYVGEDGTPLTTVNAALTASATTSYRVTIMGPYRPAGTGQRFASPVYILVTWPGQADPNPAKSPYWPIHYSGSFQTVTYLDQN